MELYFYRQKQRILKKYTELWNGIKSETETIHGSKKFEYTKGFMKTKFDSDYDLPLNKQLKFQAMTIIVRTVFDGDSKFYSQIYLHEYLYELQKWK